MRLVEPFEDREALRERSRRRPFERRDRAGGIQRAIARLQLIAAREIVGAFLERDLLQMKTDADPIGRERKPVAVQDEHVEDSKRAGAPRRCYATRATAPRRRTITPTIPSPSSIIAMLDGSETVRSVKRPSKR